MTATAVTTVQALTDQLKAPGAESKKFKMTVVGLSGIALFTFMGSGMIVFKPEIGSDAINLVTIAIGAWTAIAGGYIGAQAAVDARTTSAITTMTTQPPTPPTTS